MLVLVFSVSLAFCIGCLVALCVERSSLLRENARLTQELAAHSERTARLLAAYAPPRVAAALGDEQAAQSVEAREFEAGAKRRELDDILSAGV